MKILDMNVEAYLDDLKTSSPAPGGGSVSGIDAAQGIALTLMVTELTIGNEKYKEYKELNIEVNKKGKKIYENLKKTADEDREAFLRLSEAYKMPRGTEEEKIIRKKEIGERSVGAIEAPFNVIKLCKEALELTSLIIGKSNAMASSDLGVAAVNLLAGSKSAWLNVKINIPYLNDQDEGKRFERDGRILLMEIEKLSEEIYAKVEKEL